MRKKYNIPTGKKDAKKGMLDIPMPDAVMIMPPVKKKAKKCRGK